MAAHSGLHFEFEMRVNEFFFFNMIAEPGDYICKLYRIYILQMNIYKLKGFY